MRLLTACIAVRKVLALRAAHNYVPRAALAFKRHVADVEARAHTQAVGVGIVVAGAVRNALALLEAALYPRVARVRAM